MSGVRLHVNIDHVATIREARKTSYPDPVWAAALCELAGADGITVHLREDRRHIQDRDVTLLRQTVRTALNLEMAATTEMVSIACDIKPDICTLVPEKREEMTTEGGLILEGASLEAAADAVSKLKAQGIVVSLFIDPERKSIHAAQSIGADLVELHTGYYCDARGRDAAVQINRLVSAAEEAIGTGLRIAAGHGLDYPNVAQVAAIPGIEELNIGHAIVARAVFVGLDKAVRDMIACIREGAMGT